MLTNEEVCRLHKSKEYKKTCGFWKNWSIASNAVNMGLGSFAVNVSPDGPIMSLSLIKVFWFAGKYWVINREVVRCRSEIIETILNLEHGNAHRNQLIKNCIHQNAHWLKYDEKKVPFLKDICLKYLRDPENVQILRNVSSLPEHQRIEYLNNTISILEQAFENEIEQIENGMLDNLVYKQIQRNPTLTVEARRLFLERGRAGKLTPSIYLEEPNSSEIIVPRNSDSK